MPTSGEILFEGKITDPKSNLNQYRQKIGMVFQHFNLFANKTILENMTLAPIKVLKKSKAEAEKEAMELLARVGLAEKANAYPAQLSGGQKHESPSFALCACIRMSCCLMSLPAHLIRRWLARFKCNADLAHEGMTMVVVTHDGLCPRKSAFRVLFVDEGRIKRGKHAGRIFRSSENARLQEFLSKVI